MKKKKRKNFKPYDNTSQPDNKRKINRLINQNNYLSIKKSK